MSCYNQCISLLLLFYQDPIKTITLYPHFQALVQKALLPWTGKDTHLFSSNDPAESVLLPVFNSLSSLFDNGEIFCTVKETTQIICKQCKLQVSKNRISFLTILELDLSDTQKPKITDLLDNYTKWQNLPDYRNNNHACETSYQIKRKLIFSGSCLLIGLKRMQFGKDQKIDFSTKRIRLESELPLIPELFLCAIICYTSGPHFICFAKRNHEWYLFNDGEDLIPLTWLEVQNQTQQNAMWLLYEKDHPTPTKHFIFPLENTHLWCYQNASLQFLYSSCFFKEQVEEASIMDTFKNLTFQHVYTPAQFTTPFGVPISIYCENEIKWTNHCSAFTKQNCRCRNKIWKNGYCRCHSSWSH